MARLLALFSYRNVKFIAMAHPNHSLIRALRLTALQLKNGAPYAWGNHGSCNCGNLLQVITRLSGKEIIQYAHTGIGEWTELANDYCESTQTPVDLLLTQLQQIGLTPTDIHNLEYLEDRQVLNRLPGGFRWLKKNVREDVVVYFETFAALLEEQMKKSASPTKNSEAKPAKQYELVLV